MHKVAVIIPVKNEEKNIGRCLQSLKGLCTAGISLDIIVVDNGSNDSTLEICKEYNATIELAPHLRVSGLRNLGAFSSNSDYLAFIDADCEANEMWLVNAIEKFSIAGVGIVGCTATVPDNATWVQKSWNYFRSRHRGTKFVSWLNSMNLIVRRDVFDEVNGFDENLETGEDVDFCYRVSKKFKILSSDDVIVYHYGEADSIINFFKKEVWRGQGNLYKLLNFKVEKKEWKSIFMPLYFTFLPLLLLTNPLLSVALFIFPGIVFLFFVYFQTKEIKYPLQIFFLFYVYSFSRVVSFFYRTKRMKYT